MWYQLLIFVPLVAAVLDIFNLLSTAFGRILVLAVLVVGVFAALSRPSFKLTTALVRSAVLSCLAALLTFLLSTRLGLGAVVASALVGLVGAQVLKGKDQLVMYMGTFVGMSSALRFPTLGPLLVAGLLGGVLFELTDECWVGVGGRLGTIAAAAVVVVLALIGGI
ncbi:MAG: hypothetical protein WBI99_09865 [Limnochordia bacterium]|jgi:hypothetical protein|nr:hypothetical protein [Limnochordia bacterium]MDI9466232.1 hypothetical protein [Bacillota bacterium]NLO95473.1 hypothetical protein [Bacillota bacterium]HAN95497.1 hypothetical protein [Bacillota bacterium]HOB40124.1 hypothetical protein [Limnochordia bacterium]